MRAERERRGGKKRRNAFRVTVSEISRRGDFGEGVYFRTRMLYQPKKQEKTHCKVAVRLAVFPLSFLTLSFFFFFFFLWLFSGSV